MKRFLKFNRLFSAVLLVILGTQVAAAGTAQGGHSGTHLLPLLFGVGLVINAANLQALYTNFKTVFNEAYNTAPAPMYLKVAMDLPSGAEIENYDWLGMFPALREWLGDRQVKALKAMHWAITNKNWEATVTIPRMKILFDTYAVFKGLFQSMAVSAKNHPNELVFALLNNGFTSLCHDGKTFFATDHPWGSNRGVAVFSSDNYGAARAALGSIKNDGKPFFDGSEQYTLVTGPALEQKARTLLNSDFISVSGGSTQNNVWKGSANYVKSPLITSATAWFLCVEYRGLKPMVFQHAKDADLVAKTDPRTSDAVFDRPEYVYGVDTIDNAGYGLPELCYGSTGAGA